MFYDCKTLSDEARSFGANTWGLQERGKWQLYLDAKEVAKLRAGRPPGALEVSGVE